MTSEQQQTTTTERLQKSNSNKPIVSASTIAPTITAQQIGVLGMLSHPSLFCLCWHHTGDVCDVYDHQSTRAINSVTRSSGSKRQCPINHPWPSLSMLGMSHLEPWPCLASSPDSSIACRRADSCAPSSSLTLHEMMMCIKREKEVAKIQQLTVEECARLQGECANCKYWFIFGKMLSLQFCLSRVAICLTLHAMMICTPSGR
jgi:hypothetical protein